MIRNTFHSERRKDRNVAANLVIPVREKIKMEDGGGGGKKKERTKEKVNERINWLPLSIRGMVRVDR